MAVSTQIAIAGIELAAVIVEIRDFQAI